MWSTEHITVGQMEQGLNPGGGKTFCIHPNQYWHPPNLMYNGYQVSFPRIKQLKHPHQQPWLKEVTAVSLPPSGPSWPVIK
jgi:hypothetical protein